MTNKNLKLSEYADYWEYLEYQIQSEPEISEDVEKESEYRKWKRVIALLNSLQYAKLDAVSRSRA